MSHEHDQKNDGFKLDLSVRFLRRVHGKRLYKVYNSLSDDAIFVGTRDECGRYLTILHEKVQRQLNRKRLTRTHGKRVYRASFSDLRHAGV
ncbi:MAG: hypothetical protein JXQ29_08125 [Planctomycetes bacterium]|nr:hypothetical protein [Planctomycetota bacterium]